MKANVALYRSPFRMVVEALHIFARDRYSKITSGALVNFVVNRYSRCACPTATQPGDHMSKLPIIGILVLMLLVVSGYVSSEETPTLQADTSVQHLDPHLNYYEKHLAALGIERREP